MVARSLVALFGVGRVRRREAEMARTLATDRHATVAAADHDVDAAAALRVDPDHSSDDGLQRRTRVARWRERAEGYRSRAEACASPGARLAYRTLAECADSVAERIEALQARRSD